MYDCFVTAPCPRCLGAGFAEGCLFVFFTWAFLCFFLFDRKAGGFCVRLFCYRTLPPLFGGRVCGRPPFCFFTWLFFASFFSTEKPEGFMYGCFVTAPCPRCLGAGCAEGRLFCFFTWAFLCFFLFDRKERRHPLPNQKTRPLSRSCFGLQNFGEKVLQARGFGICEEFFGFCLLHDHASVEEEDLVSHFTGKAHFVRDDDHRHLFFREAFHHL